MGAVVDDEFTCGVRACGKTATGKWWKGYMQPPPGWWLVAFDYRSIDGVAGTRAFCSWECCSRAANGAELNDVHEELNE